MFGSVAGTVKFGADEPGMFTFSDKAVEKFLKFGLSSKGEDISYQVVENQYGFTLIGFVNDGGNIGQSYDPKNDDRLVFEFSLSKDGFFAFKLYDQMDHDRPDYGADQNFDLQDDIKGDVRELDFGDVIKATDFDGDSIILKDQVHIKIRDDIPELKDKEPVKLTVDEDDIVTEQSTGTEPEDGQDDGSSTGSPDDEVGGPATATASLSHLVRVGADEHATFMFVKDADIREYLSSLGLKSQGEELVYDLNNPNVVIGFVNDPPNSNATTLNGNDRQVFRLTIEANGDVKFELFDQLDHDYPFDGPFDSPQLPGDDANLPADQNTDLQDDVHGDVRWINFGKIIKAVDFDGDAVILDGAFKVKVRDDIPEAKNDENMVQAGMPNAPVEPGPAEFAYAVENNGGQDELVKIDLVNGTVSGISISGDSDIDVEGLAVSPGGGAVYAIADNIGSGSGSQPDLIVIDPATGTSRILVTNIVANSTGGSDSDEEFAGMAFNPIDGKLYTIIGDNLFEVVISGDVENPASVNASMSEIANSDSPALSAFAISPDGTAYGIQDGTADLYTIDLVTGDRTFFATLQADPSVNGGSFGDSDGLEGMSFDSAGNLWIMDRDEDDVDVFRVVLDTTSGSESATVVQAIFNIGVGNDQGDGFGDYEALATIPTPGEPMIPAPIEGNVLINDMAGADEPLSVVTIFSSQVRDGADVAEDSTSGNGGTTVQGLYGTLTIGADGSYSYDLDDLNPAVIALNENQTLTEIFKYAARDFDHDQTQAFLNITIKGANDGPVIDTAPQRLRVSEEGLTALMPNADDDGMNDMTDSDTDMVQFTATDPEGDAITWSLDNPPSGLTSDGEPITWSGQGTNTLVGEADGDTIITISVDATGKVSADLDGPVDHPDGTKEDEISLLVDVVATDPGGKSDSQIAGITIEDDSPEVHGQEVCVEISEPGSETTVGDPLTANFVLVLDTSESTDGAKLALIKAATNDLIDTLGASGAENIRVHIVEFNDEASPVGTFDIVVGGSVVPGAVTAAQNAVTALNDDGFTNYEAGLQQALEFIEGSTQTINVTTEISSFDANSSTGSGGNDTAVIIGNGTTQVALVSGWAAPGTSTGNLRDAESSSSNGNDNGWGVQGGNSDTQLNQTELLRFDFGTFTDFDGGGTGYNNAGSFNGVDVTTATFNLDDNDGGGGTVDFNFTVFFTDGSSQSGSQNASGPTNLITLAGTGANTGKLIDYIEFSVANSNDDGDVDLVSVSNTVAPGTIPDADLNKLIFLSDGEPNRALDNDGDVFDPGNAQDAINESLNEIGFVETDGDGAGPDQAFEIQAFGVQADSDGLDILDQVDSDDAQLITAAGDVSAALADMIDMLGGTTTDTSGEPTTAQVDLSNLVWFGADGPAEGGGFSLKDIDAQELSGVMAGGQQVLITTDGNTLVGHTAGNVNDPLFTLELNGDGTGTFTQIGDLDQSGSDPVELDLGQFVNATDNDGDFVMLNGNFTVKVAPGVVPIESDPFTGLVEEDHLVAGTNTFLTAVTGNEDTDDVSGLDTDENAPDFLDTVTDMTSGDFVVSGGNGTFTFAFASGLEGTNVKLTTGENATSQAGTHDVLYHVIDADTVVGYIDSNTTSTFDSNDRVIFSLDLDTADSNPSFGDWKFTLVNQIDHHEAIDADDAEGNVSIDLDGIVIVSSGVETAEIAGSITVIDDIPAHEVTANLDVANQVLPLEVDETGDGSGTPVADRYNAALSEAEDAGGNANTDDGVGFLGQVRTTMTGGLFGPNSPFSTTSFSAAIGADRTGAGATGTLEIIGVPAFGSGALATNLSATDGGPISLVSVGTGVLKQILGIDSAGIGDPVFEIKLDQPTASSELQLFLTVFRAIDHGDDGNLFDHEITLALENGLGPVQLIRTQTVTDGDGDAVTETATIDLITDQTSFFSFDDDGPTLTVEDPAAPVDGSVANAMATGVIDLDPGSDGLESLKITGFSDLDGITEELSADGRTLTAYIGGDNTGDVFYTLELQPDNASYKFTIVTPREATQSDPIAFGNSTGGPGDEFLDFVAGDFDVRINGGIFNTGTGQLEDLGEGGSGDNDDDVKPTGAGFGIGDNTGQTTIEDNEGFFVTVTENGNMTTIDSFNFDINREGGNNSVKTFTVNWRALDENGDPITGGSGFNAGSGAESVVVPKQPSSTTVEIDPPGEFKTLEVWFTDYTGGGNVRIENFNITDLVIPEDELLEFELTGIDGDGDEVSENFSVEIEQPEVVDTAPMVNDDTVITNIDDLNNNVEDINIPDFAVLFNDVDPDGDVIEVTAPFTDSGFTTFNFNTGTGIFEIGDSINGGSFTYTGSTTGTTPVLSDTANVSIDRNQKGQTQLDGTSNGEILLGRVNESDTILGNGGNDVLIGGDTDEASLGAAEISVIVDGVDESTNSDYLQFRFNSGASTVFISSILFTLRDGVNEVNAFFDPTQGPARDGDGEWGPDVSARVGLDASDINVPNQDSSTLEITFDDDSFGVGDGFNLNIDVDNLIGSGDGDASSFANRQVRVTVELEDGRELTVPFSVVDSDTSQAAFSFPAVNPTDDTLNGGDGDDLLVGGSGNDILIGGEGEDILDGGAGQNTLTGGDDADTFRFGLDNVDIADIITDYDFLEGDDIDLTALFTTDLDTETLADYVQVQTDGTDATLRVDQAGTGTFTPADEIATLQGIAGGSVKIVFNDDDGGTTSGDINV